MNPLTLDRPLPDKIAIVGFADSKDEAPFADQSWEMWGVNDVYFHVPRIDRSFELHNTVGLGPRRNAQYEEWLRKGKLPVYMDKHYDEYPSSVPFPKDEVMSAFGNYFTNSISWMTALALLLLTEEKDGARVARPGAQLGLWGVDMAHETEYGSQRPSCEYYVGIARALGIPCYIPDTSDLLKATSLYGFETSAPLRIKLEKRLEVLKKNHDNLVAQEQQLQAQVAQNHAVRNQIKGAMGAFKYVRGVWTMGTEIPGSPGDKSRVIPHSDGHNIAVGDDGEIDMTALLQAMDTEEKVSQ